MNPEPTEKMLREAYAAVTDCPSPESYLEESLQELSSEERARLLGHASECPRCAAERELARAFDDAPATVEHGDNVADIVARLERRRLDRATPGSRARSSWSWGLAAAAMLALTVVGVALLERDGAPPLPAPSGDTMIRGGRIEIVGPAGELDGLPAALEWEASQDAASYRVRVLRVDDSTLLEKTVTTTRIDLPAETRNDMHRAVVYFWEVEALDDRGARTAVSDRVRFRAAPE